MPSPLLEEVIAAHDPDGRWGTLASFSTRMRLSGALWRLKHVAGLFEDVALRGDLRRQRATVTPFGGERWTGVFSPDRVAIEDAGRVIEENTAPLGTFAGQERSTPWTPLQALYFAGYANWNYFVAPFVYRSAGFQVRETGTWAEDGQSWRTLAVTYPEGWATHSRVQTIYTDERGLIARLDYNVDILGGGPAAHYPSDYEPVNGILVPTRRIVYVRRPDGFADRTSISIDIAYRDIRLD